MPTDLTKTPSRDAVIEAALGLSPIYSMPHLDSMEMEYGYEGRFVRVANDASLTNDEWMAIAIEKCRAVFCPAATEEAD